MKTKKELFAEGCIGEAYGKETFLKVVVAPSIDKVKFTIVKMNTQGKDHVDFYLDIDDMRKFANDVASGVADKKFAADANEQYPKAYQFITGENGSKRMNIGGGMKGIRFNIKTPEGIKNAIVPTEVLRTICYDFRVVVGLIPVTQGTYYHSLIAAFYNGEKQRANSFRDYNAKTDGAYSGEEPSAQENKGQASGNTQAQPQQQAPKANAQQPKPAPTANAPAASTTKPSPAPAQEAPKAANSPVKITVKVKKELVDMKNGGKAFQAWTEDSKTISIIIPPERLGKGGLDSILEDASHTGSKMTITGWLKDDRFLIA